MPCRLGSASAPISRPRAGDVFELSGRSAICDAFAAGIWRDYEHQNGAVVIERADYVRLTGDTGVNTVSFWLQARRRLARSKTRFASCCRRLGTTCARAPDLRRQSLQALRSHVRDHVSARARPC